MRFTGRWPMRGMTVAENIKERQQTMDFLRDRGTARKPQKPRDLIAQSGPRGVLLTWNLPPVYWDIVGWRVYKNDESTLYHEIRDRGTRQMFVESTAATTSPMTNFFVSALNGLAKESKKIQVIKAALNEPGAPVMPGVPPGYNQGGSGGGNTGGGHGRFK